MSSGLFNSRCYRVWKLLAQFGVNETLGTVVCLFVKGLFRMKTRISAVSRGNGYFACSAVIDWKTELLEC